MRPILGLHALTFVAAAACICPCSRAEEVKGESMKKLPALDWAGWPLFEEVAIPGGEGGGDELSFSFGPYAFEFKPENTGTKQGVWSRSLAMLGEEGNDPIRVDAPEDARWNLEHVWATTDYRLLLARGEQPGGAFLQVFRVSPFEKIGELPEIPTPNQVWPFSVYPQAIDRDRIYFFHGVPTALRDFFPPVLSVRPGEPTWRQIVWPAHEGILNSSPRRMMGDILETHPGRPADRKTVEQLKALLDRPVRPVEPETLVGPWKVRSFQGSAYGHFLYPFFEARIVRDKKGLFFEKTTGSQRRSGYLWPERADCFVLLGGKSANDDSATPYSGSSDPETQVSGAPAATDTFGTFEVLDANHAIMLLDLDWDGNYEVYELKR